VALCDGKLLRETADNAGLVPADMADVLAEGVKLFLEVEWGWGGSILTKS
jgi:hypothetical protein